MKKPVFTGVCTALVTPFQNGEINYPMVEKLLHRQICAGVDAIVLAGTTGESPTLTDKEKLELFRFSKDYTGKTCKIIAGTGSNCTAHAVALSKAAEGCGVDALLVVSPYYNKATPDGLYAHYLSIAMSVNIPVIIYNVPSRTGVDIPVSVYQQLSRLPNIAGVKEASPDIVKIAKIQQSCGPDFCIWSGNDDMIVPTMALGGKGVISVLSNVLPDETVQMCRYALHGDYQNAARMQCELLELIGLLFCEVNPIPVKAAMKQIGLDCGGCRLPLSHLTPENQKKLYQYFHKETPLS